MSNKNTAQKSGGFSNFVKQFFDIKFWKFILVGIINTIVGNGLQFVIYHTIYKNVWVSSIIGYVVGSIVSYFLNKFFTFKNQEKGIKPILKFALNIAVCYAVAYAVAIPLVKWISLSNNWSMFGLDAATFADDLSMVVGSCLFVATNYIGQRYFAFRQKNV